jgi:hypothetical protein
LIDRSNVIFERACVLAKAMPSHTEPIQLENSFKMTQHRCVERPARGELRKPTRTDAEQARTLDALRLGASISA